MEHTKSRIEILLGVVRNLLDDITESTVRYWERNAPCHTRDQVIAWSRRSLRQDYEYIRSRTGKEGISFLTKTLPLLGKWYDGWLSEDLTPIPQGFKPWHDYSALCPNGMLLSTPHKSECPLLCITYSVTLSDPVGSASEKAELIRLYRSLFYSFYKLEMAITQDAERLALQNWHVVEEQHLNFELPDFYDEDVSRARDLIAELLNHDTRIFQKIEPSHGPGAVAGKEVGDEKWKTFHYIHNLHSVYPAMKTLLGGPLGLISLDLYIGISDFLRNSKAIEPVSRLLFVPKDSRGPRVISCEPKELMFVQQGVARNLMKVLERTSRGRINFIDQTINGRLALASSETRAFATVDLKDASDRVSLALVELVFPEWAHKYLRALRSTKTLLPDGSVCEHRKYAPMGSALCFPIESMIFWAFSVVASVRAGATEEAAKVDTYVYGDDIIIRPQAFDSLNRIFTKIGLTVNVSKSFVSGPFRESCGVDAWNGFDVTPLKVKKDISRPSLDGPTATAVLQYSSRCYALDMRKTGDYLLSLVERKYPGIPRVPEPIGCLHVVDPLAHEYSNKNKSGYDNGLCKLWVMGWCMEAPKRPTTLDGLSRLLKNLHGNWAEHDPGEVVVPRATKIRKRRTLVEGRASFYFGTG